MIKQKIKKLVLPLIGLMIAGSFLMYGQLYAPTRSHAEVPPTDISTYTWGGDKYHDIEVSFQQIANPLGKTDNFYSWPLEFSFVNGGQAQIGFQVCYETSSNPCNDSTSNSGNSIRFVYRVYGAVSCSGDGCAGNSSYYQVTNSYSSISTGTTYTLKVQGDGGVAYNSKDYAEWGGYVNSTKIGEIYVPTDYSISNSVSVQTQYLGSQLSSCGTNISQSQVEFTSLHMDADTTAVPPSSGPSNSYSSSQTSCQYSYITTLGNGVEQYAGQTPPKSPSHTASTPVPSHTATSTGPSNTSTSAPGPGPGGNSGSGNISVGSTSQATIDSTTNNSSSANIINFSTSSTGSGSSNYSGSGSNLTTIKSKKKHSSTLATAASVTGILILIILAGWGGYLLYTRLSKRKSFSTSKIDTDMFFDKTIKKPSPQSKAHKGGTGTQKPKSGAAVSRNSLTKEQLIAFGQEALLLEDLKDEDKKKK